MGRPPDLAPPDLDETRPHRRYWLEGVETLAPWDGDGLLAMDTLRELIKRAGFNFTLHEQDATLDPTQRLRRRYVRPVVSLDAVFRFIKNNPWQMVEEVAAKLYYCVPETEASRAAGVRATEQALHRLRRAGRAEVRYDGYGRRRFAPAGAPFTYEEHPATAMGAEGASSAP
jgi:hypothetical protein